MHIVWAVIPAAMILLLSACEREKENHGYKPGENEIAYRLGSISTRSADTVEQPSAKVRIPVGSDGHGHQFFLEETVTDLNAPITRGTPAYTENVATLYGKFASKSELGDANFTYNDPYWSHSFGQDPWKDNETLHFYMGMPVSMKAVPSGFTGSGQTISFSYDGSKAPKAEDQQDIIFAYDAVTKEQYSAGRNITFYHALTGVKFALGNENSTDPNGTKTYITSVKFSGLVDGGNCTVTFGDDGKPTSWTWSNTTTGTEFSQTYTTDNIVDYTSGSFGDSFYKAGNTKNLNDVDATMTFWFVPQEMTDDVTLEVKFYIQAGTRTGAEITRTLKFGKELNGRYSGNAEKDGATVGNVKWEAGQLRTYTLKPNEVEVEVDDDISETKKENVVITNTGNVPQYVRATFVANWVDGDGNVVYGYKSSDTSNNNMWDPWTVDNSTYGTFVGLPGTDWIAGDDGYYYYTTPIGIDQSSTYALFTSYTVGTVPVVYLPETTNPTKRYEVEGVHLVMEIVVQAVEARTIYDDSTGESRLMTYEEAWAAAFNSVE